LTILGKILLRGLKKRMVRPPKMKGDSPFWCLVTKGEWICRYLLDGSPYTYLFIYLWTYYLCNGLWTCNELCVVWWMVCQVRTFIYVGLIRGTLLW
jgi:hypothetical protein